jgi:DNA repair photolyase
MPRFDQELREEFDDGWGRDDAEVPKLPTIVKDETARSVISRNDSLDLPFSQSINPYRGCEHGCIYCYARPTHAYLGLSAGLDFESRLFAKQNAAELLKIELSAARYRCQPINLGANTDPYQPIEKNRHISRGILEVLLAYRHPATIVTKSSLVERDIDLLSDMARQRLIEVYVSVTTLNRSLARKLEPRATAPQRRVDIFRRLSAQGIPTGVLVSPIIPALNDAELENILTAAAEAGAVFAGYGLLRLPHEVKGLFEDWLAAHEPLRRARVMQQLAAYRSGKEQDFEFGKRLRGEGLFAELLAQRFTKCCERLGLNRTQHELDCTQFRVPGSFGQQLSLF